MDTVFGFVGKDFALVATDCGVAYSIMRFSDTEDKIMAVDDNKLFAMGGEIGDRLNFGEYIQKNIHLYTFRTGIKLNVREAANYTRSELAYAIRNGPYQVNLLIGGFDEEGPSLYWLDYLGTLQKLTRGAHGYGAYFVSGLLDNWFKPDLTLDEGIELVKKCINEVQTRFLMSQKNFVVKIVTKDGIRVI
eukprot:TRINITY_DN5822_c0_g1_i1.p1 TRINITY_DN5822_c0_g1~~TRINITY_DN5822_c0_g1_i1.p1  ORF type:complete len:190 (-),score=63.38 TRINITY_DN5822_c0_g1_i1:144-713(-)